MTNLDSVLKSRDVTLLTNALVVKAMVFPIVMYRCERWTIKKAESQKIDAFKLWCWRRLLRVPWTTRRSKQSILNKSTLNTHWKDWCWSWSFSTLATWCEELFNLAIQDCVLPLHIFRPPSSPGSPAACLLGNAVEIGVFPGSDNVIKRTTWWLSY